MPHLTKRQHNVPSFYLKLWSSGSSGTIVCHDLREEEVFEPNPDGVLVRKFFYEENPNAPDNRVENVLAKMEGQCSIYFSALAKLDIKGSSSREIFENLRKVRAALCSEACRAIKAFAGYQYLRVPGAISQKRYELKNSGFTEVQKDYELNPGRFVDYGFSYIADRFQSLKILVLMSTGEDFITSDWPCFDLKDSAFSPLLGEEVGINPEVVVYLPLNPHLGAVLYPSHHAPDSGSHSAPEVLVMPCADEIVRNQNSLIIQQADRFVIANKRKEDFIFRVARNRKKSMNDWCEGNTPSF